MKSFIQLVLMSLLLTFCLIDKTFAQTGVLYKDNDPVYSIPSPEERFIEKIVYTNNAVIFHARFYSMGKITFYSSKGKHPWTLVNTANRKEKVTLTDVKNIKKNKVLLKNAMGKEAEVSYESDVDEGRVEYTCEIHFPRLPETMKVADLIEGNDSPSRNELYVTFFDFKRVRIKTFPEPKKEEPIKEEPSEVVTSNTTVESIENLAEGQSLVLNNILFQSSKATLLPESYVELDKLLEVMKKNQNMEIEVSGHTDNVGKYADEKLRLSRERAESVKNYLMNRGVVGSRIKTEGYGDTKPINDNSTPEKRRQNRRVEIKILKK